MPNDCVLCASTACIKVFFFLSETNKCTIAKIFSYTVLCITLVTIFRVAYVKGTSNTLVITEKALEKPSNICKILYLLIGILL